MPLQDLMRNVRNPDKFSLKKELDLWLETKFTDLATIDRGHSGNLHASAISGCTRVEFYKRIDAPAVSVGKKDGKTQRIFDNGSAFHDRMQDYYKRMGILWGNWSCHGCGGFGKNKKMVTVKKALFNAGCRFKNCKQPKCPLKFKEEWEPGQEIHPYFKYKEPGFTIPAPYRISGYTDGIIIPNGDKIVIELKSIRDDRYRQLTEPEEYHQHQTQIYLEGFKVEKGIVQYENKNTQEIKEYPVKKDPAVIRALLDKSRQFWACLETGQLPPKVCSTVEEGRWCEYKDVCFNEFFVFQKLWEAYHEELLEGGLNG
jgi:hypothetical protein